MMTSLFSPFDPSTKISQMNWMMLMIVMILTPMNFWTKKSRSMMIKKMLEKKLIEEFMNNTKHKELMMMLMSMFMMIMIINIMGLIPYNYTPTSHPSISISMALPMWLSMLIYSWLKFTNKMFMHLLPSNTPTAIIPMMVMIEIIGMLIRPISLSIRLTANMIAGHLLMTLLGDLNSLNNMMIILPMQMILMSFESTISIIQAYVFTTLTSLYSSEIPYE